MTLLKTVCSRVGDLLCDCGDRWPAGGAVDVGDLVRESAPPLGGMACQSRSDDRRLEAGGMGEGAMRLTLALCALIMCSACADAVPDTAKPYIGPCAACGAVARLSVPVVVWGLDRSAEHPGVTLRPSVAVSAIEVVNAKNEVVARPLAGVHVELPAWGWSRARAGCWQSGWVLGLVSG